MAKAASHKLSKPRRNVRKVLASVRQVVRIEHVAEHESIWIWGEAKQKELCKGTRKSIKVCVWNIWKQSGGKEFVLEFEKLAVDVSLFLCQEALLNRDAIRLFVQDDFEAVHAATYRRLDGCRDGVATLSKAVVANPMRVISFTTEPLLKTTKTALVTFYKIFEHQDLKLAVVNFHSTLLRTPKTAVQEVNRIAEAFEDHPGPVLFAGDFNTFSRPHFREMSKALYNLGFEHAKIEADPRTSLGRLDQVFTRGLIVKSIHVDSTIRHSDHFPIVCELEVASSFHTR